MDELQRKYQIQSVLNSKLFMSELAGYKEYVESEIENQTARGAVTIDGLSTLNFRLGRKAGLDLVLNLLKSYEEEIANEGVKLKK